MDVLSYSVLGKSTVPSIKRIIFNNYQLVETFQWGGEPLWSIMNRLQY